MKKMILVNQVAGPMFVDIANFYLKSGFDVQLLTGKVEQTAHALDADIKTVKLITYRRNNPITRILTWLIFTLQTYFWLRKQKEEAEVMLVSNPPFVPLLSHFLSFKSNLVFRILIYDIYPDVLERTGYCKKNSWFSSRWRKINSKTYNLASKLYTISDGMKKVLSQYADAEKWNVVYPWVDTTFIKPIPKNENPFVRKHGLENKTVVLYSGNMGATHNLMPLLHLAKSLIDHQKYFFLFIGDGVEKQRLEAFAKKHKLTNTLFLPFQAPETLPFSLTAADIGVVSLAGSSAQLSIPSKTFYQMAAGNALLCLAPEDSELASIITNYNCGFIILPENVKELIHHFNSLTTDVILNYRNNSRKSSFLFTSDNLNKFV